MRPAWRILADARDITAAIADRLVSLRLSDAAGEQSDTAEIRLDDRGHRIELPRTGAELEISIGYRETGLADMGLWVVDEIELQGPPSTLLIRAHAAHLGRSETARHRKATLRQSRTQGWDDLTLGDLVATIARRNGFEPRVDEFLAAIHIPHLDQTDESDLHLLTRLARQYDAVAKPAGGHLLFVPRGEDRAASGRQLSPVTLTPEEVTRWQVTLADRGKYRAVISHWHDKLSGKRVPVRVGESGEPSKSLLGDYPDEASARAAAQSRLAALNRGSSTGRLVLPGNPLLAAGTPVILTGFREGVDGTWSATRVTHTIDGSGYRTEIDAELSKNS